MPNVFHAQLPPTIGDLDVDLVATGVWHAIQYRQAEKEFEKQGTSHSDVINVSQWYHCIVSRCWRAIRLAISSYAKSLPCGDLLVHTRRSRLALQDSHTNPETMERVCGMFSR